MCSARFEADILYLWFFLFQVRWNNGIDAMNIVTKLQSLYYSMKAHYLIRNVKFKRIKEQVVEKKNTDSTHGNADCLLKSTFTKQNRYAFNQNLRAFC